jgi:hypothetical protein
LFVAQPFEAAGPRFRTPEVVELEVSQIHWFEVGQTIVFRGLSQRGE